MKKKENNLTEIKELEKKLIQDYIEITNYENGRFRNLYGNDNDGYHALREAFPFHEETVKQYFDLLSKHSITFPSIPLPPFIVFPMYAPTSLGWRMGIGQEYAEYWHMIIKASSEEEIRFYCEQFDYPSWWMNEKFPSRYQGLPWKNIEKR